MDVADGREIGEVGGDLAPVVLVAASAAVTTAAAAATGGGCHAGRGADRLADAVAAVYELLLSAA